MHDPTDERPPYLVHYSDGVSGMRAVLTAPFVSWRSRAIEPTLVGVTRRFAILVVVAALGGLFALSSAHDS